MSEGAQPEPLRLTIIGLNYAPETVGIGPYTAGLAEGLVKRGVAVHAIVGQPYYPQWRKRTGFSGTIWRRSFEQGVRVTRCPHYVPARPSGWRRIVHLASFALAALPVGLSVVGRRERRPSIVLCIAPALLSVPVAWLTARLCSARLWIHVQDFEVEAALAVGLVRRGRLAQLASALENRLLRSADRVSTISPQMSRKLADKGVPDGRIVELRNWATALAPSEGSARLDLRTQWGLAGSKVALYSGNIANKQGIGIVVEAARLVAHRADLVFVICGEGPNRAALEASADGLRNVQFHGLQPATRLAELLALADIHLLPQLADAADLVLPSKLANMLASGRPVVATAAPGTGLHAEVQGCGVTTPPGDAAAFAAAIAALLDDPAQAERLGACGIERARDRWSRGQIMDRWAQAMHALADERPRVRA